MGVLVVPGHLSLDFEKVLHSHHFLFQRLSERISEASTPMHRRRLFDDLARALGGYFRAMEKAVWPTLNAHGWKAVPSDVLVGHAKLKRGVAEVLAARDRPQLFDERLFALLPGLREQATMEAGQLLPAIRRLLTDEESRSLGAQATAQMKLVFDTSSDSFLREPQDLIDEARVVLGTFPEDMPRP